MFLPDKLYHLLVQYTLFFLKSMLDFQQNKNSAPKKERCFL